MTVMIAKLHGQHDFVWRKGNRLINTLCWVLYIVMILWIQTN